MIELPKNIAVDSCSQTKVETAHLTQVNGISMRE